MSLSKNCWEGGFNLLTQLERKSTMNRIEIYTIDLTLNLLLYYVVQTNVITCSSKFMNSLFWTLFNVNFLLISSSINLKIYSSNFDVTKLQEFSMMTRPSKPCTWISSWCFKRVRKNSYACLQNMALQKSWKCALGLLLYLSLKTTKLYNKIRKLILHESQLVEILS